MDDKNYKPSLKTALKNMALVVMVIISCIYGLVLVLKRKIMEKFSK